VALENTGFTKNARGKFKIMTVRKVLGTLITAAAVTAFVSTTAMAGVAGNYKRPNGKGAKVSMCSGGGLRAVAANGTVMFKCAKKSGGAWKSGTMKHPEFPGTFNGTIRRTKKGLNVEGCFGPICPAENWTKK
jgi:hypothetical protein